jgi:hypothetical protein
LALVAYEMLTGEYPLVADGLRELLMKQLKEIPPPLSERRPDVPAHVSEAIHQALSKDPEDRFPTIDAFARALMGGAGSEGVGTGRRRRAGDTVGAAHVKTLRMRKQLLRLHRKRRLRRWAGRGAVAAAASLMLYLGVAAVSGGVRLSRREASGDSAEELSPGTGTQRASRVAFVEVDALAGDGAQLVGPPADVLDSGAGDLNAMGSQEGAGGEELAAATPPRPRTRPASTSRAGAPSGAEHDGPVRESGGRAQGSEVPASVGPGVGEGAEPTSTGDGRAEAPPAEAASSDGNPAATEPASGEVSQPTDDPTPEEPDAAGDTDIGAAADASPSSSPEWVLEQYRLAVEQEDLEALGRVYGGAVPAEDVRMLQRIFDSAEEIQVEMKADEYQIEGGRAIVNVDFPMRYVLARTKRAQRFTLKLRMTLEQAGEGWRLVALEQR